MVSQTSGFWHIRIISFVVILVTHIGAIAAYETMRGEQSLLSKFLFGVDFHFGQIFECQNFSYFEQKKKKKKIIIVQKKDCRRCFPILSD